MHIKTIRRWSWVHKWTSLICTAFILMLCVTGLPLIFKDELDDLFYAQVEPARVAAGTPHANLDAIVASANARYPGEFIQFVVWPRDEPDIVRLAIAKTPDANPENNKNARFDVHTGRFLDEPDYDSRITHFLLELHTDLFAGLPGKLFLGFMGLLFVAAIVSGVVLYGPWMRKLDFGTLRWDRRRLARWLDLHNLLGAVTILWALTVGVTGVLNTWADLVLKLWQIDQLADMTAAYKNAKPPATMASVQVAVDTSRKASPQMTPLFIAYPASPFSSKSHYAVFMRGETPLTSRLLKPVLIDAANGQLTDSRHLPWYVTALLVSQPLHFGDYGGMPLKIIWALLDVLAIVVLVTGLYLWVKRARRSTAPAPARYVQGTDQRSVAS
jgi:uncharacterized iron-regulated membrane protein